MDLRDATECCGFGGTFAVKNPETSAAILADKSGASSKREPRPAQPPTAPASCTSVVPSPGSAATSGLRTSPRSWRPTSDERLPRGRVRSPRRRAASTQPLGRDAHHSREARPGRRGATRLGDLSEAGRTIKGRVLRHLDDYLLQFEQAVERAGGTVHWARDGEEACRVVARLVDATGEREVVKVKSLTTDEIRLNERLAAAGIDVLETDLSELICQLAGEGSSHILVPAIHKNRIEIRDLFRRELDLPDLSDEPRELAEAARLHLRERFLRPAWPSAAPTRRRRDGDGLYRRVRGERPFLHDPSRHAHHDSRIEKLVPTPEDLEVFLQLLPRSSTGERMNLYTSLGPGSRREMDRQFHVVLLDAGRTDVLADEVGRQVLAHPPQRLPERLPGLRRTGGHAYESVYPGPIGAILTPQLRADGQADSLPYVEPLRCLLRGAPGQDRHPGSAHPSSRPDRLRGASFAG